MFGRFLEGLKGFGEAVANGFVGAGRIVYDTVTLPELLPLYATVATLTVAGAVVVGLVYGINRIERSRFAVKVEKWCRRKGGK